MEPLAIDQSDYEVVSPKGHNYPVVLISDIHFHNFPQFGFPHDYSINTRMVRTVACIEAILQWAKTVKTRMVIFCGDTFDNRFAVPTGVLHQLHLLLNKYKRDTISSEGFIFNLLAGNHDQPLLGGEVTSLSSFDGPCVNVINTTQRVMFLLNLKVEWRFDCYPYMPAACLRRELNKATSQPPTIPTYNKCFAVHHTSISGAVVGPHEYRPPSDISVRDLKPDVYDFVFSGHYHKHQYLRKNVAYVGSPMSQRFGEEEKKGFMAIGQTGEVEFVPVTGPQFETIEYLTADNIDELPRILKQIPKSYVRIIVKKDLISQVHALIKDEFPKQHLVIVPLDENKVVAKKNMVSEPLSVNAMVEKYVHVKVLDRQDRKRLKVLGSDILSSKKT